MTLCRSTHWDDGSIDGFDLPECFFELMNLNNHLGCKSAGDVWRFIIQ